MNMLKVSLAAGVVAMSASTATAATIMIDSFDTFQQVADSPVLPGAPNTSTVNGDPTILGGSRELTVDTTPDNAPATNFGSSLTSTGAPNTQLIFNNNDGQQGLATVVYGTDAGGAALGDLTDGGTNDKFLFEVTSGDLPGSLYTATVTDTSNASFTVSELLVTGFSPFQAFADFTGVDFENVASLTFTLDSNGVESFDGSIGSISAVPLPASALLLLGGIGGLAGFGASKRRRRKS
ncbi:MAG: hypothetical protein GVY36_18675 [Verrucomicrobia bacterium]|jgi:hypothetical protein|nr:hypothetical protein [Verrucomicrobiota bacterium]